VIGIARIRNPPGYGKIFQAVGFIKNFLDQTACGSRIIESNVLSDGI